MATKTLEELQLEYGIDDTGTIDDIVPILEGNPMDAYSVLRSNLEKINSLINSTTKPASYNPSFQGELRKVRTQLSSIVDSPSVIARRKKFVYGIVIASIPNVIAPNKVEIYIDVPGFNNTVIGHPDDLKLPGFQMNNIIHLKFYPVNYDENLYIVPVIGGIAKVEISETFPTYSEDLLRENIFLGMYDERGFISCRTDLKNVTDYSKSIFNTLVKDGRDPQTVSATPGSYSIGHKFNIFDVPVPNGKVVSIFGYSPSIRSPEAPPEFNSGIDIEAETNSNIYTPAGGEVIFAGMPVNGDYSSFTPEYGNTVAIKHNRTTYTTYSHLESIVVKVGQKVEKGDLLGIIGQTGAASKPMLHFELRKQMVYKKSSVDPSQYLISANSTIERGSQGASGAAEDSQEIPEPLLPPILPTSRDAFSASRPINRPKMIITKVKTDQVSAEQIVQKGSDYILAREDIVSDLENIKSYFNFYEIPFSCKFIEIDIKNNNSSPLSKVGLEINLNPQAGLTTDSYLERDEYYICPDYSRPIGMGYRLNIYGNIKRKAEHPVYKYEEKILDIYSINDTYLRSKPVIRKIFRPVVNISKMFHDHGFIQGIPGNGFFEKSNVDSSRWFVWYKPSRLQIGSTYREMLETVYDLKKFIYLEIPDMVWNGEKFVWQL